jgi:hypothetical protein
MALGGFTADGRLLATANARKNSVSVFSVDESSAVVGEVPGSPFLAQVPAYALAFSPSGSPAARAGPPVTISARSLPALLQPPDAAGGVTDQQITPRRNR